MWPQRIELCGSGTFLKSLALQDFLLQIRTLTSLICLSPGASLWRDTDFACRAELLLSLNSILQILKISVRRGERVIVSGEENCVGGSSAKNWRLEWYLVKYGCHTAVKEPFGIFFFFFFIQLNACMHCTLAVMLGESV